MMTDCQLMHLERAMYHLTMIKVINDKKENKNPEQMSFEDMTPDFNQTIQDHIEIVGDNE